MIATSTLILFATLVAIAMIWWKTVLKIVVAGLVTLLIIGAVELVNLVTAEPTPASSSCQQSGDQQKRCQ